MSDEERKYGKIPTGIYRIYLKSCGLHIVLIFFLCAFGWQALRVYTDFWLRKWTDSDQPNDVRTTFLLLYIYICCNFISTARNSL